MNVSIKRTVLNGRVKAPPSKSYSHRYLIASMLSKNESEISNIYFSDDILATLNCISAFGRKYLKRINSVLFEKETIISEIPVFDCHESGSTLRFMIPISLSKYNHVFFKGTERLISRGISVYEKIFKQQNIKIIKNSDSLEIVGHLRPGIFNVDGSLSSQYITGLLFSLPLLDGDSVINIIPPLFSKPYIDLTLDILNKYSIEYQIKNNQIFIKGNQKYVSKNYEVESDYSNAAFLDSFNYFGSNVQIEGLNPNSLQGDKVYQELFRQLREGKPTIDISNAIDLGPILFTFASLKNGAIFINTDRLKNKESDRVMAMKEELEKVGVKIDVLENKVVIHKSIIHEPQESFNSHNDHRISMALSLLSTRFDIMIQNADVVKKSYPSYFKDLESLGAKITYGTD